MKGESAANRKLFPGRKKRAFCVSYDDGALQDIRLVELMNKYGIRGTFNLNSGLMKSEFEWVHESGMVIKRLSPDKARGLYVGHEVSSHTVSHPWMDNLDQAEVMRELGEDRDELQRIFGCEIRGFAVPFDYYSNEIADCARACGFEYVRISEMSMNYTLPEDPYYWRAGIFHLSDALDEFVDGFLACEDELPVCEIVGHSYDLDVFGMWDRMEQVFKRVSMADDVAFMTNLELARFKKGQ